MLYKILLYFKTNPIESKILGGTTFGSFVLPLDLILKFIIPLSSAITWFFLKPVLIKWQKKRKERKDKK